MPKQEPDWSACILAVARARDVDRFAQLFAHFAPLLKGFLVRSGMAHGDAEDIAQAALLAVWNKAGYFDPSRASASTWIFTIARNMRSDMQRKARVRSGHDPSFEICDPQPGEHILLSERDYRIHAAVKQLPPEQAEVVRLAFFEDWHHADIAAALDIPLGTVKSRVRLAMVRLRKLVEDSE